MRQPDYLQSQLKHMQLIPGESTVFRGPLLPTMAKSIQSPTRLDTYLDALADHKPPERDAIRAAWRERARPQAMNGALINQYIADRFNKYVLVIASALQYEDGVKSAQGRFLLSAVPDWMDHIKIP